uniref:DDE Tnp4 domain-containing protein n=1 Tax=Skeletonema marinoi TaxID=267567 RepID=A0A7S2PXA2_9STRA|mmetsp:Transcript_33310/g.56448  ORF Transcript_33310/g.56448 Transcript_33310/m.56448 type:complete len:519 (+) Transcript_33310:115-1671(+)
MSRRGREDEETAGERQSRRRTSWQHRDTSSLSPAQMDERDTYFRFAEDMIQKSVELLPIISSLLMNLTSYYAIIQQWSSTGSTVSANVVSRAREKMIQCKAAFDNMTLLLVWIKSYAQIALLHVEDLTFFSRRPHRFPDECYRTIESISSHQCYSWFGVDQHQLQALYRHWRIPQHFRARSSRHRFEGEACFIIFMYHMIKGSPFTEMSLIFGGDPRKMSPMFEAMVNHMYETFYHKISGTSMNQWIPQHLDLCRELMYNALSRGAIEETVYDNDGNPVDVDLLLHHFDFDSFRPFGVMDDFAIRTARPGGSTSRRQGFTDDIQRVFYSGYFKDHGLKVQVVYLPMGLIGSVYVTELRQNDNGVQNMSGLNDYLLTLLRGRLVGGLLPALYVDGIFANLPTILPRYRNPTPEQHLMNMRMASLRQIIEHVFGDHRTRFRIFWTPQYLYIFNQGVKIRRMALVSFFILNCYYCINGGRCAKFQQVPPTLEEYIPLDEELLPPPAVNLGQIWDYGQPLYN